MNIKTILLSAALSGVASTSMGEAPSCGPMTDFTQILEQETGETLTHIMVEHSFKTSIVVFSNPTTRTYTIFKVDIETDVGCVASYGVLFTVIADLDKGEPT